MWLLQNSTDAVQGQARLNATTSVPQYIGKSSNSVNLNSLYRAINRATQYLVWKLKNQNFCGISHGIWKKCPRNGANKPDISVLDKVNKEWFITEGTICFPGTIPARTMFKGDKYADLRIGVKSLYSGHKDSSIEVIFDFLVAYSTHLENKMTKILQDKKVVSKTSEKSQK